MTSPATATPQSVMREVTEDIIRRAIKRGRKKRRT
ncbi:MAG: hypothetical protein H6Q86_4895, partial [candidate division NC10 bacterium]|nr:hypothetical protein [candidate division NC10 bacterium]